MKRLDGVFRCYPHCPIVSLEQQKVVCWRCQQEMLPSMVRLYQLPNLNIAQADVIVDGMMDRFVVELQA